MLGLLIAGWYMISECCISLPNKTNSNDNNNRNGGGACRCNGELGSGDLSWDYITSWSRAVIGSCQADRRSSRWTWTRSSMVRQLSHNGISPFHFVLITFQQLSGLSNSDSTYRRQSEFGKICAVWMLSPGGSTIIAECSPNLCTTVFCKCIFNVLHLVFSCEVFSMLLSEFSCVAS